MNRLARSIGRLTRRRSTTDHSWTPPAGDSRTPAPMTRTGMSALLR